MRSLILASCLLASPAIADDAATWGVPMAPTSTAPNSAQVELCDDGSCYARVVVHNTLVSSWGPHSVLLEIDGLQVWVAYEGTPYMSPDVVTVTPPAGYIAEPPSLTLEENSQGVILIVLGPVS